MNIDSIIFIFLVIISLFNVSCNDDKYRTSDQEFDKVYNNAIDLYNAKKYKDAIPIFEKALSISDANPVVYLKLGHSHQMINEFIQADKYYNKYINLNPDADHRFYYNVGFVNHNIKNFDKSISALQTAIKLSDKPIYSYFLSIGMSYYAKGDYENAVKYLSDAINLNITRDEAHYYLGKSYYSQKKYSQAIKAFEYGHRHNPNSLILIEFLAWLLATSPNDADRDGSKAVKLAEIAVDFTKREDPNYLDTLAAAYAESGQFEKAIETEQNAINILINTAGDENVLKKYENRLRMYESGKPWRITH